MLKAVTKRRLNPGKTIHKPGTMAPHLTTPESVRSVGRPRNETTRKLILSTTLRLLEKEAVQAITIEAIAKEAGVSKATIYRWWSSKVSIVIDAFVEFHIVRTPMRRDQPPPVAIALHVAALTKQYSGWPGRIVSQIVAEGQTNAELMQDFRERFHYARRAVVREMLDQWRKMDSFPGFVNPECLLDLLYAPIYMRLFIGHGALDEDFVLNHLTLVYRLLGVDHNIGEMLESLL